MKKKILILITFLLLLPGLSKAQAMEDFISLDAQAIILEVEDIELEDLDGMVEEAQDIKLEITSGKYKGEEFLSRNYMTTNLAYNIVVEVGDRVVVVLDEYEDYVEVYVSDYVRQDYIFYLLGAFILLILIIGRMKGLKSVITLAITIFMILKVFLPGILNGMDPVFLSIGISIIVTLITIFTISGFNTKSISAIIGTISGVLVAGIIAYYVGSQIKLTGLSGEEATMLMYTPLGMEFDFRGLLFSGIILGALGAIMDIGMSISSSIEEINIANPDLKQKELFKAGMNVGKDIMGTMTNTLILAYTGASIPLLLLFMSYETSLVKILNLDVISSEIVRSLSGSIGLILTIPLTAFVASMLIKHKGKKASE